MTIQTLDNGLVVVPRADWGARGRAGGADLVGRALTDVFLHHSVTPINLADPCENMRTIENVLIERKLDPGYSWAVDMSGVVLEGAGTRVGAHTKDHNSTSVAFVFPGNYDHLSLTMAQLVAVARMINLGRLAGLLHPDLDAIRIRYHSEVVATGCPGAHVRGAGGSEPGAKDFIRMFAASGA